MTWDATVAKIVIFFKGYWVWPDQWEKFEAELIKYLADKKGKWFKLFVDYEPLEDLAAIAIAANIQVEWAGSRIFERGKYGIYALENKKIDVKIRRGTWGESWYYE